MADAGLTAFAMELMPRITRAQVMDVLSSQANLAGYQAVIDAAAAFRPRHADDDDGGRHGARPRASSSWAPASPGLQAIATARRLGAVVTATDVRPAAKEQVASLGAKFVASRTRSSRRPRRPAATPRRCRRNTRPSRPSWSPDHIAKQDIVITTALIPGPAGAEAGHRRDGRLDGRGSVIVDLAVERGGNVEGAGAGEVAKVDGVKIIGHLNVPGRIAATASALYAAQPLRLRRDDDRQGDEGARRSIGTTRSSRRRC